MIQNQEICNSAREVVQEVVYFIKSEFDKFDRNKIEKKGFNDLVSYVDKTAEEKLVAGLQPLIPEAGFILEEADDIASDRYKWIIDPLDGTTNFVHGLPVFAISVALMDRDQVIVGIVHDVFHDDCYHATADGPAFCREEVIKVSSAQSLGDSLIATGFPYYDFEKIQAYLDILKSLMQKSHGLRRMGSAAMDLVFVATGKMEAYFEYNLNSYDVAAGALIVDRAGGKVSDFKGGTDYIFGRQILASNGHIHSDMLDEIGERWKY
jgi:myo-inositol-1(or 4)-monophosphatase